MNWKNWPHWARGAVWGFVVGVLIVIVTPIACPYILYDLHGSNAGSLSCNILGQLTFIPMMLVAYAAFSFGSFFNLPESSSPFLFVFTLIIIFILLGMLISGLYRKIRNRKTLN